MTKRFTSYLADDLPGPQNPIALDQSDAWSGDHEKDQCYLWTVITNLEKEVEQVYDTVGRNARGGSPANLLWWDQIRVQIDGKDGSRNILFAVLASLYLPFTLATVCFGILHRTVITADSFAGCVWYEYQRDQRRPPPMVGGSRTGSPTRCSHSRIASRFQLGISQIDRNCDKKAQGLQNYGLELNRREYYRCCCYRRYCGVDHPQAVRIW